MPHFVIEYSKPVGPAPDISRMMHMLCDTAVATGIMERENIKLRAIPYDQFQLNDGSESFIHLTISLLDGRTSEQKEELAIACRAAMVEICPQVDAISVDIRDMDSVAYKKRVKA